MANGVSEHNGEVWIFGYGSLMWNPGFAYAERAPALLRGYHRAFCVYSRQYRGTPERPGLVLGLQVGGSCRGVAYRIAETDCQAARAYLREREMVNYVYEERQLPIALHDSRRVLAHTYVADAKHPQYTGRLPLERVAELVCQGVGARGACAEYLANTVRHLDELGIKDSPMHKLLRLVEERQRLSSRPSLRLVSPDR